MELFKKYGVKLAQHTEEELNGDIEIYPVIFLDRNVLTYAKNFNNQSTFLEVITLGRTSSRY